MIVSDTYQGRVDINRCEHGRNLILFYLSGVAGSMLVIGLCQNIRSISLRKYMSGAMLVIAFNLLVIGYFKLVLSLMGIELTFIVSFIVALVILSAFYPIIIAVSKYIPALIGYRK